MTLTTHAIVGAATARVFSFHPVAALFAAVVSHYLIDAIPHWDYHLRSAQRNEADHMQDDLIIGKDFFFDLLKIGFDCVLGFVFSVAIFQPLGGFELQIVFIGVVGGVLPDFLQFVYFKFRREPMISLQRFHHWIHTDVKLNGRWIAGIVLQIALIIALSAVSLFLI